MSYLLDKRSKRNKYYKIALGVVVLLFLLYFKLVIFNGFSYGSSIVFRPVLTFGNSLGEKLKNVRSFFDSKNSLLLENENLKSKLNENNAISLNYNSILAENASLKEILGRKSEHTPMTLAAILAKPNQSLYDTLVIDAGSGQGLRKGDQVFALGNVPIGRVAEVYPKTSKVILFSNSGEKTQVIISGKNVFMELTGRGGGNFEMILPRDFVVQKGDEVVLPGITPYVVGIVETILSDPRDAFQKALIVTPLNIQELKFVEVAK